MPLLFEFHHLVRTFPNQDRLVYAADAPVVIKANQLTLIRGGSGIGKSSLVEMLNTMATADPKHSKKLMYHDPEGREHNLLKQGLHDHHARLRRRFGYLPQHRHLADAFSIWENVRFTQGTRADRQGFAALLKQFGLGALTKATWRRSPAVLSGGMAQRLALLRAFHSEAHVFFGDEPATHLPADLVDLALQLIKHRLQKGTTPIVLCHATDVYLKAWKRGSPSETTQNITILHLRERSLKNQVRTLDIEVEPRCL